MRYPSYLYLSQKEWAQKIKKAEQLLQRCQVCPRACGINRARGQKGFCRVLNQPIISSYFPHFGEEPPLVGENGSGTIFFTHCNLACVYCQNYEISHLGEGRPVSIKDLAEIMLTLQGLGCHNINFVSPTPYIPIILKTLPIAIRMGLKIPLVYNTNGYDSVESLTLLDGIIDIYMPDFKYSDDELAQRYSAAPGYFEVAQAAICEMHRQVGDLVCDEKGIARRGLLIRHLVLPNGIAGSQKIIDFIAQKISKNTFLNI